MKIGIDVSVMTACSTGTEEYVEGLVGSLSKLPGVFLRGLSPVKGSIDVSKPCLGLNLLSKRTSISKVAWETWGITRNIRDLDVIHIPYMSHPPSTLSVPVVVTVHDTIPYLFERYNATARERLYFSFVKRNLRHSQAIVAISEATQRDIERIFPELSHKVRVIPNGIHTAFFGPRIERVEAEISKRLGLRANPRILYIGGYDDRKNVVTLLLAAQQVFETIKTGELVLVGAKGKAKIQREISRLRLENFVRSTDYLSRQDLVSLYHISDIFAFPSKYEGFGLPPAQALATGVPVVAANTPAVAEVVQSHGLLVNDISSPDSWSYALLKLIDDSTLRKRMGEAGRERAGEFIWQSVAEKYMLLYKSVGKTMSP